MGREVAQYLPSNAGNSFVSSIHETPSLAPWTGLVVLTAWVILSLTAATLTLKHRDV